MSTGRDESEAAKSAKGSRASEPGKAVTRLITELGVARLVGLIAAITREEADDLLVAGDPQNAASHMRDFWIVERAAAMLRWSLTLV